jgi:hypothetical protein
MVDAKRKTFGWLLPTDSCGCVRDRLGFCGTLALICAVLLLSSQFALAQFTQQGPKLVGNDAVADANGGAEQGSSVSLSADGNTAIVGGPSDNGGIGAAWVFVQPVPSLQVTPATNIVASGMQGGPFYQLSASAGSINYSISVSRIGLPLARSTQCWTV